METTIETDKSYLEFLRIYSVAISQGADGLFDSYESDKEPFLLDDVISFPPRKTCDEYQLLQEIFFPKYFNCFAISVRANKSLLKNKIAHLGWTVLCGVKAYCKDISVKPVGDLLLKLHEIREKLKKDVYAAFIGDPACTSYSEVIRCYPGFGAIMIQRVAHVLYEAGAKVYPRELTELAHMYTGVDIHPGAQIGDFFFIDHATGTVIGESSVIGSWCRLYQSVTIGALHFKRDEITGFVKKNYKRHPTLGNNVVVGSGAKVLGPITIGDNVSIGANSWIQEDIPSNTTVFIEEHPQQVRKQKKVEKETEK